MGTNYDLPIVKDRDKVRFLIGDTNMDRPFLEDDEIAHSLSLGSDNILRSSAYACDAIAAKLIRDNSISVQGITISRSLSADGFKNLAREYRKRASTKSSLFTMKVKADKTAYENDAGLIKPDFRKEMHDNKEGGSTSNEDFKSASCT